MEENKTNFGKEKITELGGDLGDIMINEIVLNNAIRLKFSCKNYV